MMQIPDIRPAMPEIVMAVLAMAVLLLDLVVKRKASIALLSILTAGIVAYFVMASSGVTFSGMYIADSYSLFFKLIFLISLVLSILISIRYIALEKVHFGKSYSLERVNFGEYYSLMLFSTLGMMIMASAGDIIVLYLGLELMSLSLYVLAGFFRHDTRSNEASLKYFLLGAFASA